MAGLWLAAWRRSVKAATTRADAWASAWADAWERDRARQRHERRVACARKRVADTISSGAWLAAIRASYAVRVREHNNRIGTQPEGAGAHHGATAGAARQLWPVGHDLP